MVSELPGLNSMMAQWTNDKWVSTLHRIVAPSGGPEAVARRRMAIAFFLTYNYDVVIVPLVTCCGPTAPAKYAPVTAGEYLFARLSRQYSREGDVTDHIHERVARQSPGGNSHAAAPGAQSQAAAEEGGTTNEVIPHPRRGKEY